MTQIIIYLPHTQAQGCRTPDEGRCWGAGVVLMEALPPSGASCLLLVVFSKKDPKQNGAHFFLELDMRKKPNFLICPWAFHYRGGRSRSCIFCSCWLGTTKLGCLQLHPSKLHFWELKFNFPELTWYFYPFWCLEGANSVCQVFSTSF